MFRGLFLWFLEEQFGPSCVKNCGGQARPLSRDSGTRSLTLQNDKIMRVYRVFRLGGTTAVSSGNGNGRDSARPSRDDRRLPCRLVAVEFLNEDGSVFAEAGVVRKPKKKRCMMLEME